jgi:SWI/SNF-related matrix-associated actin-dependent regulator 1 of chromatin subfamily A
VPDLFPHQAEAVEEITSGPLAHRYLADEQGLGKTATALRVSQRWDARLTLVICPASAVPVWVREAKTWWPEVTVITPRHPDEIKALRRRRDPCLVVINYDLLSRNREAWVQALRKLRLDVVICDEAHRLKNPDAARTIAVFGRACDGRGGIIEGVPHVLLLSGTPITRYHQDLWAPMRALWPERLWITGAFHAPMNRYQFRERFCRAVDQGFGERIVGNRNVEELARRLAGKPGFGRVVIRRTKPEVLKDLPPVRIVLTPLAVSVPDTMEYGIPEGLSSAELEAWIEARTVRQSATRRLMGEYKVDAAGAWLTDWLADNPTEKLIVFAVHRAVLGQLFQMATDQGAIPVLIDGETPLRERDARVARFQTQATCRVFLGQIAASGEAITLHAASTVVFAETDWNSTSIAQAVSRAHRIGQTASVLAHILIIPDSWDEKIHAIAARKAAGIADLWLHERQAGSTLDDDDRKVG